MPEDIEDLYHSVNGYDMPKKWQDFIATLKDKKEETGITDIQRKREAIEEDVIEWMADNDVDRLEIPQSRLEDAYPELVEDTTEAQDKDDERLTPEDHQEIREAVDEDALKEDDDTEDDPTGWADEDDDDDKADIQLEWETLDAVDEIVDERFNGENRHRDEAIQRACEVYQPFLKDKPNEVLKKIAKILVRQGEIDKASEAEVVNYALKGLMQTFAQYAEQHQQQQDHQTAEDATEQLQEQRG